MSDAILRQWAMLRALPRHPRQITAREVTDRLQHQGFECTKRTIERDLERLSEHWPITANQRNRPYGWFWMANAEVLDIPGMDLPAALAFQLAREYLAPLLPPPTLAHLQPHFDRAAHVLDEASATKLRAWPDKVRVIGHGPSLLPPKTMDGVHERVLQALFENRRIEARYTPRETAEERDYVVNPLGAVFRQSVVYLVGTLWDYDDVKQFALHRFSAVELTDTKTRRPRGFDLDEYIRHGAFGYPAGNDRIRLKAVFDARTAHHLYETPLSEDQTLAPAADGRVELAASVLDTEDLRWWLLGFGDSVEVKGPVKLRREMAGTVQRMAKIYG